MELDAIETHYPRPARGGDENAGKDSRKLADMFEVHVVDALARAVAQVLELARA